MDMTATIAAILLSLTPFYKDARTEEPDERSARMLVVAQAINDAANRAACTGAYATEECSKIWHRGPRQLAGLLITQGYWESRFALHVQQGRCGPTECDAEKLRDGRIVHRARSYWQIQATGLVPGSEWRTLNGTDLEATSRAAWAAAKVLSAAERRCGRRAANWAVGTVSGYAGGISCSWSGAGRRVAFFNRLDERLRAGATRRESPKT